MFGIHLRAVLIILFPETFLSSVPAISNAFNTPSPRSLASLSARLAKVEKGERGEDEGKVDPSSMIITKRHFNFAMAKARRSVTEKDLVLFQEFAEKQKAGRGKAATEFKFEDDEEVGGVGGGEDAVKDDDLY